MKTFLSLLSLLVAINAISAFVYPKVNVKDHHNPGTKNAGTPLYLTPLIQAGSISEAQQKSRVLHWSFWGVKSYSGYFTVDETDNSNLFFWYFPAEIDAANAPTVLWLSGGPGWSSLLGQFTENGPLEIINENLALPRQYTWTKTHNVIYIDSPVGTGFSFTEGPLASTEDEIGNDLYSAMVQFFQLFPNLQANEFYIAGESYAGKYIPTLASKIHDNNPTAVVPINLQGLFIGNGLCDPLTQLDYAEYLYQHGLIDEAGKAVVKGFNTAGSAYITAGDYLSALIVYNVYQTNFFIDRTGFTNFHNYLESSDAGLSFDYVSAFLQRDDIRKALHVGTNTYNVVSNDVGNALYLDIMQSVKPQVESLLENYRIMFYNGQLDIIVAYPLTVNFLKFLSFPGKADYDVAARKIWMVGDDIAGYAKTGGLMTEVLVRNAGHQVPIDQPKWSFDLLNRFTSNTPFA